MKLWSARHVGIPFRSVLLPQDPYKFRHCRRSFQDAGMSCSDEVLRLNSRPTSADQRNDSVADVAVWNKITGPDDGMSGRIGHFSQAIE